MLKTIIEASQNFCIHQIRVTPIVNNAISNKKVLTTYIDIDTHDGIKHRVYIASCSSFMQRVSKLFLEEDESDEETLKDMALETANLIVGSAKVIAEEANLNPYTIGTPYFETNATFNFSYDEIECLLIDNDTLIVAIKELS